MTNKQTTTNELIEQIAQYCNDNGITAAEFCKDWQSSVMNNGEYETSLWQWMKGEKSSFAMFLSSVKNNWKITLVESIIELVALYFGSQAILSILAAL